MKGSTQARGCDGAKGDKCHPALFAPQHVTRGGDKKVFVEAEEREYKPEDWISTWKRVDSP